MRDKEVDPVIRAGVMDHRKVELGPEVYDHATLDEKRQALRLVAPSGWFNEKCQLLRVW